MQKIKITRGKHTDRGYDVAAEKITRGKYTDRGYNVTHAHIWKSATQVSVYVMNRMAQNLELYMAITFDVGIIGR